MPPPHTAWLAKTTETITTADGLTAEVWELQPQADEAALSAWAKHFREHYCEDHLLDKLREDTGLSRAEFLNQIKFPDGTAAPGPSIRSGDFAEILVADYIEFKLGYWCPRTLRYDNKWNRNESTKGCDVVGFKFVDDTQVLPNDELFIFEAKATLTGKGPVNRLQDAVDDSVKDKLREGMTLSAMKQRLLERGDNAAASRVQRFQDINARPFKRVNGAAAVLTDTVYCPVTLSKTTTAAHPNKDGLKLIVVKGPALMQLVSTLFERAANEA